MNHSSLGSILVSRAIIGFVNYKTAEGLTVLSVAEPVGDIFRPQVEKIVADIALSGELAYTECASTKSCFYTKF